MTGTLVEKCTGAILEREVLPFLKSALANQGQSNR